MVPINLDLGLYHQECTGLLDTKLAHAGTESGFTGEGYSMDPRACCGWIIFLLVNSLATAQPVVFNDTNLKASVEAELGLNDPTSDDMLGLTFLSAAHLGISDLTGLETALNLQTLYLYNNQISHISALSGLTSLETLALHNNQISDISALAGLTGLIQLSLGHNQISDISILSGLTGLQNLTINNNQIVDLSSLSTLQALTILEANDNLIGDISALSGLRYLSWIDLNHNRLQDVSGLTLLTILILIVALASLTFTWVCQGCTFALRRLHEHRVDELQIAGRAPLFEYFNQDVAAHRRRFQELLPAWIRAQ